MGPARQAIDNLYYKEANEVDEIRVEPAENNFVSMRVWNIDIVNTSDGSFIKRIPFVSEIKKICISNANKLFVTIPHYCNSNLYKPVILSYNIE